MPPFSVTVHPFPSPTPGACAYERGPSTSRNALVYIGGLTAGPHSYDLGSLVDVLEQATDLGYSLWEFRMRSSYSGFGHSSLTNDVEDMAALVRYLRRIGKERVVFMGASTGCQDCLEYTNRDKYQSPPVDGYILQSPVSDRESAFLFMSPQELEKTVEVAKGMIDKGKKDEPMPEEFLPPIFGCPVSAYRWYSLAAKGGDDDYFSSDLPDAKLSAIFGRVDKPVMIMPAGEDELVPPTVDRVALLKRWTSFCRPGVVSKLSGLIPGGDHVVSQAHAQSWVSERVVAFLRSV